MVTYVSTITAPFGPDNQGEAPKLCKTCKHFIPPPHKDLKFGRCSLFGEINLIDGEVSYPFASNVRSGRCRGKYHSEVTQE